MLLLALPATTLASGGAQSAGGVRELRLAVEPTLQRAGLLELLLPVFEAAHRVRVVVRALPPKDALELGASGGADLVWVGAPRTQVQYLNQGFYLDRRLVLYTDHVLVGPPGDPAGVRGSKDTAAAFRRIAQRKATFVSGGERAASYPMEQEIWKRARAAPAGPWYVRADAGNEAALPLAVGRGAYALADRSAAEPLVAQGRLQILLEGMRPLRRGYHVMEVNPNRFPSSNYADAKAFADYLVSPAAQDMIRALAAKQGNLHFFPGAGRRDLES